MKYSPNIHQNQILIKYGSNTPSILIKYWWKNRRDFWKYASQHCHPDLVLDFQVEVPWITPLPRPGSWGGEGAYCLSSLSSVRAERVGEGEGVFRIVQHYNRRSLWTWLLFLAKIFSNPDNPHDPFVTFFANYFVRSRWSRWSHNYFISLTFFCDPDDPDDPTITLFR